jgi:hypothetical protein
MNRNFYASYFSLCLKSSFPFWLLSAILFSGTSCNIINPSEPVPAYVQIDSVLFAADSVSQGSSSTHIIDAWADVDGTLNGTYELPSTFPVLTTGTHRLTIRPGILIDGIASARTDYPFYAAYDTTVNFQPGQILHIVPSSKYYTNVHIDLEDFDRAGTNLVKYPGSDTTITPVHDQHSFEGKSGVVYLDQTHQFFECAWKDSVELPLNSPSYMELNYMCTNEFVVGLLIYTPGYLLSGDIVTFRASETWKKVYVNLSGLVTSYPNAAGFKIFIKATKSTELTNAVLYFDNIKVLR